MYRCKHLFKVQRTFERILSNLNLSPLFIGVLILCALLAERGMAAIDIIGLPTTLDQEYDLTWSLVPTAASPVPVGFSFEGKQPRDGYRLLLEPTHLRWQPSHITQSTPCLNLPLDLATGQIAVFTLKRRQAVMALLLNHQLIFTTAMPDGKHSSIGVDLPPDGWRLMNVRYHAVGPHIFGDDFMRPEVLDNFLAMQTRWVEDPIWSVARCQGMAGMPGIRPATNPWQLSFLPYSETVANGFWYNYIGVGPSWVIAQPTLVPAGWDRYFMAASVRPDYDSEVGLIVAYQDNENYVLFRWQQADTNGTPRAVLTAIVEGTPHVLASATEGFIPTQWYRLQVNLGWKRVEVLVDDRLLLSAENPGMIEGQIGLYADQTTDSEYKLATNWQDGSIYRLTSQAAACYGKGLTITNYPRGVYFDDIRTGDWRVIEDLSAPPYLASFRGQWVRRGNVIQAASRGQLLSRQPSGENFRLSTQVTLPPHGRAGILLCLDAHNNGYLWELREHEQRLCRLQQGQRRRIVTSAKHEIPADTPVSLDVTADGPFLTFSCDKRKVFEYYAPTRHTSVGGITADTPGVIFHPVRIEPLLSHRWRRPVIHDRFVKDPWLATWSSPEAEWAPAQPPVTVSKYGAAAPLPTEQPGLYWHKGGHYHAVEVVIPLPKQGFTGQDIYLTAQDATTTGYRLHLSTDGKRGKVQLYRRTIVVGERRFPLSAPACLVLQRQGAFILLSRGQLSEDADDPVILSETPLLCFHDRAPLPVEQVGVNVTTPDLPAAAIQVNSDRMMEAFETAPTAWSVGSGIWAVRARYVCDPEWNWYGGFGPGTPLVWSKQRLLGNQTVEAYFGIIMKFPGVKESYAEQFRDTNLSICADGIHPLSGYSLLRCTQDNGERVTELRRNGVVVMSSTEKAHLLPLREAGHREWFASRLERTGATIRVFLDNRLAMTYTDPDPLPGGYIALWTRDNGIVIGRVNYSAETRLSGTPHLFAPVDATHWTPAALLKLGATSER